MEWKNVCRPKNQGGLSIIELEIRNVAIMLKMLWNLCGKSDSLQVKWIHAYYIKHATLMEVKTKTNCSWIMKDILQQIQGIENLQCWDQIMHRREFTMKAMYLALRDEEPKVTWKTLLYENKVRPRLQMIMWLACHGKLATKARLHRFSMSDTNRCCFCLEIETIDHLFFSRTN